MNPKTVLIAEDDALLRSALTDKLTREGFTIQVARDGEECLQKALAFRPDLILLDILMPRMDGRKVLKKLRDDPWGAQVKVILLTNMTDAEELAGENPYQSNGYLIKSDTKITDVVVKIQQQLNLSRFIGLSQGAEVEELSEYRCTCGKLLFKGALLFSTVEIKCKRCAVVRRIDTAEQELLG